MDQVGGTRTGQGWGEEELNSQYTLKVVLTKFADGLDVGVGEENERQHVFGLDCRKNEEETVTRSSNR